MALGKAERANNQLGRLYGGRLGVDNMIIVVGYVIVYSFDRVFDAFYEWMP